MTWIAPAMPRGEPPYVADERTRLDAWLDYHRATLLCKCAGLTAEQLAARPVASSALSPLGPEHPDGAEFALAEPASAEADFALYGDEIEKARLAVVDHPLDERFGDETVTVDLRWLYAHMIDEYARHNGHADLIRELVDGATGL
jgi:hypothetical protein